MLYGNGKFISWKMRRLIDSQLWSLGTTSCFKVAIRDWPRNDWCNDGFIIGWGVNDYIKALSFDTTSSNTEKKKWSLHFGWNAAGEKVLYLAPWHHIHEILLEEAFSITMGLDPRFCFSKDIKHFCRTLLSLMSNLE